MPDRQRCLYCEGELGEVMFSGVRDRLGVSDKTWTFRRCKSCGSAVLDPMPTLDELLAAYPPNYHVDEIPQTQWLHRLQYGLEMRLFYEPIWRYSVKAVQRVTGLRGGKLLDVGGGSGHRSALFQQAGFEVTVLDPDERALQIAQARFGLRTVCGLLEETDLPENGFDLVTFWFVIEHLPNPKQTLAAAHRVLRPGGWLVALVPLADSWQAKVFRERWTEVREAPRHVGLPTQKGMECLLERSGLQPMAWVSGSLLCSAGIVALSLVPAAATPIACGHQSFAVRFLWRLLGISATLAGLPFAWLEKMAEHPRAGIFFATKPENQKGQRA